MSVIAIRAALETGLTAISPALGTATENGPVYTPVAGTPYQRVRLVWAKPKNDEQNRFYMDRGFMQVDLLYPPGQGTAPLETRFQLIRATFYHGASFTSGGVKVNVGETSELGPELNEPDRYARACRVPFYAHITA